MTEQEITGQTGTNGAPAAVRKLRAQDRRDGQMAAFCDQMVKRARQSDSVSERRDAAYWADLAAFYRQTVEVGPVRKRLPNTRKLEFFTRAIASVEARQVEEVAHLRADGVAWEGIGQALGVTRQAARKRFGEVVAPMVDALQLRDEVEDLHREACRADMAVEAVELEEALREAAGTGSDL